MILFREVSMKNFLSHGDNPNVFFLNKSPTTIISGKNGNGKSSIMDGITFALFGKGFRDIKKNSLINSINQSHAEVSILFNKGDKEYRITRGIKPNILKIESDGTLLQEDASVTETQKYIEGQILGFDYNTFCRVCIMSTMNYAPFMSLSAWDRRNFVENMLDLKMFSEMNKIHKNEIATIKDDIQRISTKMEVIDTSLKEKRAFREYIKTNSDDELKLHQTRLQENIKSIEDTMEKVKTLEELTPTLKAEADEANSKAKEKQAEIYKLDSEIKVFQSRIRENDKTKAYVTGHDHCGQCKQTITNENTVNIIKELDESNSLLQGEIDKLQQTLDSELTPESQKRATKYSELRDKLNAHLREINTLDSEKKLMLKSSTEISKHIKTIKDKSTVNAGDIDDEIKSLTNQKDELKLEFEEKTEELKVANVILELLKDTGIKADIIKQYIPLLCAHVNSYLSKLNISLTFTMDENFNESIRTRYTNEFTYDNLSAGERSRVDLALSFSWRQIAKLKGSVHTNLLILDEVLDANLDDSGTQAALEIVNDISQEDTNVFIVSHKANLEEHVRSVLVLDKVNGFTKIR